MPGINPQLSQVHREARWGPSGLVCSNFRLTLAKLVHGWLSQNHIVTDPTERILINTGGMDKDVPKKAQGVVFRRLSCHGSGSAARFQVTFASYALAFLQSIATLLRLNPRPDQKIQILRNLDGVISPGEMLLVLGRPGSGCSTFLKALGGMCRGFHVDDKSRLEYHGWCPISEVCTLDM